jgi:aminoglycoside phosphotransferase
VCESKPEIPVPILFASFDDDAAAYLIMEYVEGVSMTELGNEQRAIQKLEKHLTTIHGLSCSGLGGP